MDQGLVPKIGSGVVSPLEGSELAGELSVLLPELVGVLAPEGHGSFELTTVSGEHDLDRDGD